MSKYARKPNKVRVARFATPDEVIRANPIGNRYSGLSDVKDVLSRRHADLKSWRVLAYELAEPHPTLTGIVKRDRQPTAKLIKKINNTYGTSLVFHPLHVTVAPLPCGHAELVKRCPICNPPTKYAPHPVMRVSRLRKLLQNPYLQS